MSRRRIAVALVACWLMIATAHATDVLELIPGNTLGYVVINRIGETDEKIQAMAQRMKLATAGLMSMVKTKIGIADGMDESGSIALSFLPTDQGPTAVLYVPVDDYTAFITQLEPQDAAEGITSAQLVGRPVIIGKQSSHAVIAWPKDRTLLQKVLADEAGGRGGADTVKIPNGDHNFALGISTKGVEVLTALGQQGLEQAKAVVRQQFAEDSPAVAGIEVYVQLLNAFKSEVAAVAAGWKLEDGGAISVDKWVWVQPTGQIAPLLRDAKPYRGDLLKGLPNMPYVVAMGGLLPSGAVKPMMDFSGNMMKAMPQLYGLTPDQVDKMMDLAVKYFPDMRGMSFVVGVGKDDAPVHSEMLGAMYVGDAQAFMTKYRDYWEELQVVLADAEGSFLNDVEMEDVTVDNLSVLKISMPIPGIEGLELPNQEELDGLMDRLYGTGNITFYLAAADDETVLMAYNELAVLRQALRATTDDSQRIAREPAIVSTSEHLPTGAHMVGYWSASGTIAFANRIIRLVSGSETGFQLPAFPDAPPMGWAMTATPEIAKFSGYVPAETIAALGRFVEEVKQLGGAGPPNE